MTVTLALLLWLQAEARAWWLVAQVRAADARSVRLVAASGRLWRLTGDYVAGAAQRLGEVEHPYIRDIGDALDDVSEVMHGSDRD